MARRDRPTHRPPTSSARGWTSPDLERLVREALSHLYDLPYLQTHPLARLLDPPYAARRANLGKAVEETLVEAIEALCPGPDADPGSHSSRGYRLLRLRYVEGQAVEVVQRQLGIGRSEYYRDHRQALEALTSMLVESGALRRSGSPPVRFGEDPSNEALGSAGPSRSRRGNLSATLTSFVGREREKLEVARLLAGSRLLTLTGAGGCGKTRLALEVAAGLLDEYPDGIWLVDLAPGADPALVPQTVASAIGIREQPGKAVVETLVDSLRARRLLLLLDNCEHLVDACAQLVETLLKAAPELRVLATSRQTLGVPGETAWRVPSLELPPEDRLPDLSQLAEYESVRLFLERASLAQPGFALTARNAPALVEVCRRLDGMPLSIELAAARIGGLTVEQIAARLDDRFLLLTAGPRTASHRQRTLKAAIDWSHDLLPDSERALFRRLAVFGGGWTLDAAEEVCGGGLDSLLQLVNKSLVLAESGGREARYRFLETIRQYAWERLHEAGEAAEAQRAHGDTFLRLVEQARPELRGPRQKEWLDRLEVERVNLRVAMRWLEDAGDAGRGLRMAGGLFTFWMQRGPYGEAIPRLRALLDLPGAKETPLGVEALAHLATFTAISGDHKAARPIAEEALRLGRALGDRRALGWALWAMGGIEDDPQADRRYHSEALAIFREIGDQGRSAHCLWRLGQVAEFLGDLSVARAHDEESLSIFRELGDIWSIGSLLHKLARVALLQGDLSEAWELLEESLRYLREAGDRTYVAHPTLGQAVLLRLRGEYERARGLAEESLSLGQELGDQNAIPGALDELGLIASAQGDLDLARRHHEANLARGREQHNRLDVAWALASLGLVARAEGDNALARRQIAESLATMRELGVRPGVAACLGNLGVVALNEGKPEEAGRLFRESLILRREMGLQGGIATLLESFGGLAALGDQPERALRLAGAGDRIRGEIGNVAPPVWRRQRDLWLDRARQELDPERAVAAFAEGQAMTLEQAVEYALQDEG